MGREESRASRLLDNFAGNSADKCQRFAIYIRKIIRPVTRPPGAVMVVNAADSYPVEQGDPRPPVSTSNTALRIIPVDPCRVADTREANRSDGGPVLAGRVREFTIPGAVCAIPGTAKAYALNVTVVPQGPLSWPTLWPKGQPQPAVSTLNS